MHVINLHAGPGAGKSTTAAHLFALMKQAGYRVELVTEYAKDLTYEGDSRRLGNQALILGEQYHRLRRLADSGVDWAITDSPLLLGSIYAHPLQAVAIRSLAMGFHSEFQETHVLLRRVKPYATYGRSQTEAQARELDATVEAALRASFPEHITVDGNAEAASVILKHIAQQQQQQESP